MRQLQPAKARPNGHNAKATIEMPPHLLDQINRIAEERMTNRATILREAVVTYLRLNPPPTPSTPHSPSPVSVVPD